ncbi:MAG TPA: UPF0182 family protein [Jiangellaceae bacterium]|nr:UPF0182 family protein [Jiangellaceae bacterium]
MPADPFGRNPRRRSGALVPTLIVLGAITVVFALFVTVWTERLWYNSLDFGAVFTTQLLTRVALFVVFALVIAAALVLNVGLAYRYRPQYRAMNAERQNPEQYRQALDPARRWLVIGAAVLVGVVAGGSAASQWETVQLWMNGGEFGSADPQFGTDIGFYAFSLPWYQFLLGYGFAVVVVCFIGVAITHYLYGGLRLQSAGDKLSGAAQVQLSVLVGLFVLLKAVAYWVDRYALTIEDSSQWTGAVYTDVSAVLPAKTILTFIALICAVLFFVNVWRRSLLLPGISLGLLLLSAGLMGWLWPSLVQQFQVNPNEQELQSPYIERNMRATRTAYGVDNVQVQDYEATTQAEPGQLADDAATVPGARLIDPNIVSPAFTQLQQVRGFYTFSDRLDFDRYPIEEDGSNRDLVVAAREISLDGLPDSQQNWINRHTTYTHGYGVVAAYSNTSQPDGSPRWAQEDIPSRGQLGEYEPRIYYGENSPEYSIVGAHEGADPVEFDVPEDPETGQPRYNTYGGGGGVPMDSFLNQTLYAAKFQEANILLSDRVNDASTILYDREPRQRVEKVAPWLNVDGNAYPAVVDGRVKWIVDGYTTLNSYPYSQRVSLETATSDSRTEQSDAVAAQPEDNINYIRNSVKAVVDAYDGSVTLYEWDQHDPVLHAWREVFPNAVHDRSEISQELMTHLRYPEDLFKVQRYMLAEYHVDSPAALYTGQDRWLVPNDPTAEGELSQPPYYQTLAMPGAGSATFSLSTTYVPQQRNNLAGFMAVNADPTSENYGLLRLLTLPSNTQISGPEQVANDFETNPEVAQELSLLRQGDAETVLGNLLTLPVGGGLLYVQPVYVERATGDGTYPLLRRVLVSFGEQIGYDDTLEGAVDDIFGGEAGVETEEPGIQDDPAGQGNQQGGDQQQDGAGGGTGPLADASLEEATQAARQAFDDAQSAQAEDRWQDYGTALGRLDQALTRIGELQDGGGGN